MDKGEQDFATPQNVCEWVCVYLCVCLCVNAYVCLYNIIYIDYSDNLNLTLSGQQTLLNIEIMVYNKIWKLWQKKHFSLSSWQPHLLLFQILWVGTYTIFHSGAEFFSSKISSMLLCKVNITLLRLNNIALCSYTEFLWTVICHWMFRLLHIFTFHIFHITE